MVGFATTAYLNELASPYVASLVVEETFTVKVALSLKANCVRFILPFSWLNPELIPIPLASRKFKEVRKVVLFTPPPKERL